MNLSTREMDLIIDLEKNKRHRKRGAAISFGMVVVLLVLIFGFGFFPALRESPFLGVGIGAAVAWLIHVFFAVRPEDKLIGLLQRYVNADSDAISQLSKHRTSGSVAA